jgi:hypothetical protein
MKGRKKSKGMMQASDELTIGSQYQPPPIKIGRSIVLKCRTIPARSPNPKDSRSQEEEKTIGMNDSSIARNLLGIRT